ncbi:MAG: hypothetical protein VB858_12220 [Planctomycetaceae bacterium]
MDIFTRLHASHDMQVTRTEFSNRSHIRDTKLAENTFLRLDQKADKSLTPAECLPVWDRREQPPVITPLIVKRQTCVLPAKYLTLKFRRRIEAEVDVNKLPPVPKIRLILELKTREETL